MRILLSTLLLSACIYANDIQVLTANSMQIELDNGTKVQEIFFGTEEAYVKNSHSFNKAGGSAVASFGGVVNSGGNGGAGAAAGFVGTLISAAIIEGYNSVVSDNNYVLLTKAINSKGEVTFLKTMVISNDPITLEEAAQVSAEAQNNLIKG